MPDRGRKPKITKKIIDEIVNAIKAGCYIETAAAISGIHKDTLYDWLKKADQRGGLYLEFSDAVKKALAESEARDIIIIGEAAKTQWQAAAWRLERRFHERWGRKERQELQITNNQEVSEEDIDNRIKQLEKKIHDDQS